MRKVLYNSRQFAHTRAIPWLQGIWMRSLPSCILRRECLDKSHVDTYWNKEIQLWRLRKVFYNGKHLATAPKEALHGSATAQMFKVSGGILYAKRFANTLFNAHKRKIVPLLPVRKAILTKNTFEYPSEWIVVPFRIRAFLSWVFMDFFIFLAGTHSGLKPFQCKICQKSFAISGDLTAHMRVCHIRLCNWTSCSNSFFHPYIVDSHRRSSVCLLILWKDIQPIFSSKHSLAHSLQKTKLCVPHMQRRLYTVG